jgi:predicted TIM-barrel fold metal-dependent hydrolase
LLFGSGQPFLDAGPALLRLSAAGISDEDKQKIAGENLERLLNG